MSRTKKLVYPKWPDQIFPVGKFVFSHEGHFGMEDGSTPPPPMAYGHCNASLGPPPRSSQWTAGQYSATECLSDTGRRSLPCMISNDCVGVCRAIARPHA